MRGQSVVLPPAFVTRRAARIHPPVLCHVPLGKTRILIQRKLCGPPASLELPVVNTSSMEQDVSLFYKGLNFS